VASSTLANYSDQLSYFLVWLSRNNIRPSSAREVDYAFEAFLHSFYAARKGKGLALARNALFGLFLFYPHLRLSLPLSRRALKGWEKLCPSVSHPPLSWELAVLLSVQLIVSTSNLTLGVSAAVGVLLAWEAYLRVGELCGLQVGDILFKDTGSIFKTSIPARFTRTSPGAPKRLKAFSSSAVLVSLRLASTKTGPNQWAQVRSPLVAALLASFMNIRSALGLSLAPSAPLFPFSSASFRIEMARVGASFALSPLFTPHSLRHGHATADYEAGATVQDIAVRGRWRTLDSLLIYVQSGPALSLKFKPKVEVHSLALAVSCDVLSVLAAALRRRAMK
jgi:integrase